MPLEHGVDDTEKMSALGGRELLYELEATPEALIAGALFRLCSPDAEQLIGR